MQEINLDMIEDRVNELKDVKEEYYKVLSKHGVKAAEGKEVNIEVAIRIALKNEAERIRSLIENMEEEYGSKDIY